MPNTSIWPIDTTVLGTTTLGQSESRSNGDKGVLCIPKALALLEPRHQIV